MNSNNSTNNKRIVWIDWAKAILIALVCVGHFSSHEIQKLLIWGFHMPAFFFISGYLYKRRGAGKTLVSFVIPVICYSLLTYGVHIIKEIAANGYWNYMLDFEHPWYKLLGLFFIRFHDNAYNDNSVMGLWFIIALIVCRLLAGDVKKFTFVIRYRYIVLAVLLVWLTIEPLIWDYFPGKDVKLYYGVYAMPFFLSGYIVKDLNFYIGRIHPLLVLAAGIVYCVITLSLPRIDMPYYQCGPTYILFFVNAMCGSLCLFWVCTKLSRNKIIEVFSVGTLLILMTHPLLDYFILAAFYKIGIVPDTTFLGVMLRPWFEMAIEFLIFYYPIVWLNSHAPILLGKTHGMKGDSTRELR